MKLMAKIIGGLLLLVGQVVFGQGSSNSITQDSSGEYTIIRNGQPYFVKGAGATSRELYAELAKRGGNSIRTWGVGPDTQLALDSAHEHGLSVLVGLWVRHESAGFNYDDETAVQNQLEGFRQWVVAYKDHPAVLGWGIGNEVNLNYSNLKVWDAINDISEMVHEVTEGRHLTCTVTAGANTNLFNHIEQRAPNLDFLGINLYGGINAAANSVKNSNWSRPYMLTEWGTNGPWESPSTSWGCPLEKNSSAKAADFDNRYDNHVTANQGLILGSYAFLWSSKLEGTPTWFGLFVGNETTEMVDVLEEKWSGEQAQNRAPKMLNVFINNQSQSQSIILKNPDSSFVKVFARDFEDDSLTYEYLVQNWPNSDKEDLEDPPGATFSTIPYIVKSTNGDEAVLRFRGEHNFRNYRLFVLVRDGNNNVATASFAFRTELEEVVDDNVIVVAKDAYIRDGAYSNATFGLDGELEVKASGTDGFTRKLLLQFPVATRDTNNLQFNLQLFGSSPIETSLQVSGIESTTWLENEISWNNYDQPSSSNTTFGEVLTQEATYDFDITELYKDAVSRGDSVINLLVEGTESYIGDPAVFYSRESGFNVPKIQFSAITSIDKFIDRRKPLVFPNPSNSFLQLENEGQPYKILAGDGQLVYQGDESQLNVSHFKKGVFFVCFEDGLVVKFSKL